MSTKEVFVRNATDEAYLQVELVQRGEAVGVIAAQSIGEPGTQLNTTYIPRWGYCIEHRI